MPFYQAQVQIVHDPAGWKVRAERAKAKIARQRDPIHMAVQRVRILTNAHVEAEERVREEWAQANQLVRSPIPPMISPHAAAMLAAFLTREELAADDLTKLEKEDQAALEQAVAEAVAAAHADQAQARADLARLEAQKRAYDAMLDMDYTDMPMPTATETETETEIETEVEVEDVLAAPDRSVAQVGTALNRAGYVDVEVCTDEDAPVLPARRGPGRPPKASS